VDELRPEASDIRDQRTRIRRVIASQIVGRRQARRLSRRVARVGVTTPPERLQLMLAGAPEMSAEVADFTFTLIAAQLKREQFAAKIRRMKRRGTRSLIFAGLVLVTLNFLVCMAYALFSVTLEASPL
jgi:hypothetical protein